MREHLYKTPEGFADIPFLYTFDGRSLTNGTSPEGLILNIEDEPFYLRSVVGMNSLAATWRYYDQSSDEAQSELINTSPRYTVVPERRFDPLSAFRFDLGTVAVATNGDGNEIGFIGWQGVKRVPKDQFGWPMYQTQYDYWEHDYSYVLEADINFFADQGAASRDFEVEIRNGDFELGYISISEVTTGNIQALPADPFLMTLYAPNAFQQLSNVLAPARWFNFNQGGGIFNSVFPVPALVYPVDSQIRIRIESLIDAAGGTRRFQFVFRGTERKPC